MRLILVRHGETDGESSIRYYGRTDVPLSPLGRAQLRCTRAALAGERFAAVYASALVRSIEGARLVSGGDTATTVAGFNEIDFGDWEGLTEAEIRTRDPARCEQWRAAPAHFHYPGGESVAAFRARGAAALRAVLAAAPPGTLLFVLHKGVIRTILTELLGPAAIDRGRLAVDLASIHILQAAGGGWEPELLDGVAHLAAPLAASV